MLDNYENVLFNLILERFCLYSFDYLSLIYVSSYLSSIGTSDPYVKFRYNNKLLYKSSTIYRDLRPRWYEKFALNIEDVSKFLYLKVYDYDFALKDDFMGEAYVDMGTLELDK